jgi:cell division septum initiation protein DivIVA
VIINITIDTREALSDEDKALLRAIGYMDDEPATADSTVSSPEEAPAPVKKTAKKAAAKKAAAPSPSSAPEPEPGPEVESSSSEAATALRDAAHARASDLLSSGQRDRVMEALAGPGKGASRVRHIAEEDLQAFYDAISD